MHKRRFPYAQVTITPIQPSILISEINTSSFISLYRCDLLFRHSVHSTELIFGTITIQTNQHTSLSLVQTLQFISEEFMDMNGDGCNCTDSTRF